MKLSVMEESWIRDGNIKAVLRGENIPETVGDPIFSIDEVVYTLKEKKRWSVQRCVAKRVTDWGTRHVSVAKSRINFLYGGYASKKIVYLIIFEKAVDQKTLQ